MARKLVLVNGSGKEISLPRTKEEQDVWLKKAIAGAKLSACGLGSRVNALFRGMHRKGESEPLSLSAKNGSDELRARLCDELGFDPTLKV